MRKYIIKTYGCQMNEHDSERMSYMLQNLDYTETDSYDDADLIIYNTCIIRKNAELKVYGHLGAMKALKKKNPQLIIAVCGCMMQIKEAREVIREKYKHVDIVFGTKNLSSLPYLLNQFHIAHERIIDVEETDDIDELQNAIRKNKHSAYVNIVYGCDNFCSYCIVPYTRGRENSRSNKSILTEIRSLGIQGYKEITLLGQNVNSYGKDMYPPMSFSELLRQIETIGSVDRIRFLTSHPKDLGEDLIDAMRDLDKVCNHIHLPLQSGSNRILKKMNRKYTIEEYTEKVDKLKSKIPGIAITTDIIIGFPGETEEDFEQTLDAIRKIRYDQVFIFKYSKRVGTGAAKMKDQVDEDIKSRRFQQILDLVNDICYENNSEYLGRIEKVLIEGKSKNDPDKLTGRTESNKIVHLNADDSIIGSIVDVEITGFSSFTLEGKVAK
ncbi:MAG: tRNA (N6-isopentenyl adenosine(37)-C2)-methylthiotransferase MiaB [Tissierellia bacterium]|nr:tRNA (N6-isopentenyl adenosine(37)-C2)-methylthiotransferase MiaB [Tissierellia bacterium]